MSVNTYYNPDHSHVAEGQMMHWLAARDIMSLDAVPGIGAVCMEKIIDKTKNSDYPIDNTYALIGFFLHLKRKADTVEEHVNRFYHWVTTLDCKCNSHAVTKSIAEKVNITYGGLYTDADIRKEILAKGYATSKVPLANA